MLIHLWLLLSLLDCWLTTNGETFSLSSPLELSISSQGLKFWSFYPYLKPYPKSFKTSHLSQRIVQIWIKGHKKESKGKGESQKWFIGPSPRVSEIPVAPVSENRWHQFLSAEQGYTRDLPLHFYISPLFFPTTQQSKRRGESGDSMAIWGFHHGIQGLSRDIVSPFRWDRIPLCSRAAATSPPCQEVPKSMFFPRSIYLRLVSQIPLVVHHISTPRSLPLHWIEVSSVTLLGHPT